MRNLDTRLTTLEAKAMAAQRSTFASLVALCEAGRLTMAQMTDAELERIVASSLPGETLDMRQLSDAELEAIINGGQA